MGKRLLRDGRGVQDWTAGHAASPDRFTLPLEFVRFLKGTRLPQEIALEQVARLGHFVERFSNYPAKFKATH